MKFAAFITLSLASSTLGFSPPLSLTSKGFSSDLELKSSPSNEQSNAGTPFMKSDQIRGIADTYYGNASAQPSPLREAARARQGGDARGFNNPALTTDRYANPSQIPSSLTEATRTREIESERGAPGGFNHPNFASGRYANPCEDSRTQPMGNSRTNNNFSDSNTFYTRVSNGLWDTPFGTRRSHLVSSPSDDGVAKEEIQKISQQIAELKDAVAKEKETIDAMIAEQKRKEALLVNSRTTEKQESQPELAMSGNRV
jgi:hypothetical protein